MRFLVLGGGMQGRVVAANLAGRPDVERVLLADARPLDPPAPRVETRTLDALDPDAVRDAMLGMDAAVTALPGAIGHRALGHLATTGIPLVDVSFMPEAPWDLHDRAKGPLLVDMGVAPGLSHVLAGMAHRTLGGLDRLTIRVGGLPLTPPPVFRHAVYFHAEDLLDEYTRPARLREGRDDVTVDPLDAAVENLDDPEVGPLEAFPSDGLRSLLDTFPDVPDMVEATLRAPGHLDVMRELRALGLLDPEAAPATAAALARRFPAAAHPDRLLMEVVGERGERRQAWRVHDTARDGLSAMSRTTASSAAAAAVQLARGALSEPGVHAPERLGLLPGVGEALLDDLRAHGVRVQAGSRLRSA